MRYQLTLEVPDDFNPEEMGIELSYKDEVTIVSEGFTLSSDSTLDELLKSIEVKKETIDEHSVVIFKFPKAIMELPEGPTVINMLKDRMESEFGCPAVGYLDDIDILVENADEAINMFNGMIAKVKVRSAVGNASKIILT